MSTTPTDGQPIPTNWADAFILADNPDLAAVVAVGGPCGNYQPIHPDPVSHEPDDVEAPKPDDSGLVYPPHAGEAQYVWNQGDDPMLLLDWAVTEIRAANGAHFAAWIADNANRSRIWAEADDLRRQLRAATAEAAYFRRDAAEAHAALTGLAPAVAEPVNTEVAAEFRPTLFANDGRAFDLSPLPRPVEIEFRPAPLGRVARARNFVRRGLAERPF